MYKLTSVLAGIVVTGGAVLAFGNPASAQGWPCTGCSETTRVETQASEGTDVSTGLAALSGLTAAGLAAAVLRRRRANQI